jgi:hypothetical protein
MSCVECVVNDAVDAAPLNLSTDERLDDNGEARTKPLMIVRATLAAQLCLKMLEATTVAVGRSS